MTAERKEPSSSIELENDVVFPQCENVVWVSGYGGAGKSTLAEFLQRERGYTRWELGAWLRRLYKEEAKEKSDRILPFFDWIYDRVCTMGDAGFSLWILKSYVLSNPDVLRAKKVVIPSARSVESVNFLKESFPNATQILVAVDCDQQTRAKRIRERMLKAGDTSNYGLEDLEKRDRLENSTGIREVYQIADVMIKNEGSLEEFIQVVSSLFPQ